jgi:4-oxalocrotonate tautomerase
MPLVHITMLEGRTQEKIDTMIESVSKAVADSLGSPISSVTVSISEMTDGQYGIGGKPWHVIKAERAAAEAATADGS